MPRNLTTTQFSNASENATQPIILVKWEHSGIEENLSASGTITFNGEVYVPGGINVKSIKDDDSATLELPATQTLASQVQSGTFRGGKVCKIYSIPALPASGSTYDLDEAILKLDGVIETSKLSNGKVSVTAIHRFKNGLYTPRNNFSSLSSYIPPAGTILTWEGENYTLESTR